MSNNQQNVMLNRLKAALAEQGKTNRWLSEQLGKSENTVSRWCANKTHPKKKVDIEVYILYINTSRQIMMLME